MKAPRYAKLASELFARDDGSIAPPPPSPEARAEAIYRITEAITASARRRRIAGLAVGAVSVAAAIACVAGVARWEARRGTAVAITAVVPPAHGVQITAHPVGGAARVVVAGSQAPLAEGLAVAEGSRVVTPVDGRTTLAFSTGTTVVVGEDTDMTLGGDGETQVLRLSTGWIDLHVAKLSPTQQFIVDTPDSEVEVRGTRFRVSVAPADSSCANATMTHVAVTEGVVVVRHGSLETRLLAGNQWPDHCVPLEKTSSSPPFPPRTRSEGQAPPLAPSSTLADQNELFGAGLAEMRRGDAHRAIATFEHFVASYPASTLTESAIVERMRLLRDENLPQARLSAKQYLGAYPNGFARSEAEAILAGSH